MRVLKIIEGTSVDGPGLRTSVYLAGCRHHCPGCHNPQSWDPQGGTEMSVDELMQVIDYARKLDFVSRLYLCGHSQGGVAAVLAAGLKPDVRSGLILLAPAMGIKDAVRNGGFPKRFFDPDHIPDETKVFDDDRISGNYYRVNRLLPLDDAIALYGDRPVLVVHSTTDEYVPYHYAVRTAGAYRNAELFTVPDDDHCFTAHMDLVAAKMIGFLDRLEGRSGQEQDLCR